MKIWLIWSTNVGKSTMFNRLIGTHRAIITDIAGTTRDIIKEKTKIWDIDVIVSDSPWLDNFDEEIVYITSIIKDSDLILFVIDNHIWLGPKELQILDIIRKEKRVNDVILIANKCDKRLQPYEQDILIGQYSSSGIHHIALTSAKLGHGFDELEYEIMSFYNTGSYKKAPPMDQDISFAIIGRPNTGKSTLLNTITKQSLSKVSDIPGTTLDYIQSQFSYGDTIYKIIDTAGIRRKSKLAWLESIAFAKTKKMLEYYKPIVVILLDWSEWIANQDQALVSKIIKLWLPILIAINKIDLLSKDELERLKKQAKSIFTFASRVPIIYISWQDKLHLDNLIKHISKVHSNLNQKIPTNVLNRVISSAWLTNPPKFPKNKVCKIKYTTQIEQLPPTFLAFVNDMSKMNFSLNRRLENVLRKNFVLDGVSIKIEYRDS